MPDLSHEWLWGWDKTSGIVSVWADLDGRAIVWRRDPASGSLFREDARFRPWLLLDSLTDLRHLGARLKPESQADLQCVSYEELAGPGGLRYVVRSADGRALANAVLAGARQRLGRAISHLRDLGPESVLTLAPEDQYLVASGRTYFKDLSFDQVTRMQFDLETTGLDPARNRIFLIALRDPQGTIEILETRSDDDTGEGDLLTRFFARVRAVDPDVIENHNLHGFDMPFVVERARRLGVPLVLARTGESGLLQRAAARGASFERGSTSNTNKLRRTRYTMPGRELIDSLDAVRRHDFSARDLPGHGLKAVARHFGIASPEREYLPGARVHQVFKTDPARVRHYAANDVAEAAGLGRLLGGAAFALAKM
ncbi:MAG TPA: 3'-5' exonuclease, partial [Polyangiaceae bacterium]